MANAGPLSPLLLFSWRLSAATFRSRWSKLRRRAPASNRNGMSSFADVPDRIEPYHRTNLVRASRRKTIRQEAWTRRIQSDRDGPATRAFKMCSFVRVLGEGHGSATIRSPDSHRLSSRHPPINRGSSGARGDFLARLHSAQGRNKPKITRNQFGCVNVGNACTKADQCCSEICEGNTRKKRCQAHNAGRIAATWKCLARTPTDPTRDVVSRPPARALLRRRRRPMLRMQQGQRVRSVLWQACGVRALSFLPERDGRIHDGLHRSRPGMSRSGVLIAVVRRRCAHHPGS